MRPTSRAIAPAGRLVSALLAPLLAPLVAAHAQCANPYLPLTTSTRALAMGDANIAGRDDDVIFYGPAQLAIARGTSVAGERYADGSGGGSLSTVSRLSSGGVGVGVAASGGRDGCGGVLFSPGGVILLPGPATFARAIAAVGIAQTYKRFRVGATAKYAVRTEGDRRDAHFLGDVGVSRDLSPFDNGSLTLALAVQNIGPTAEAGTRLLAPLRAALGAAVALPAGPLDLVVAAEGGAERLDYGAGVHPRRGFANAGIEAGFSWLDGYSVAIRAGSRTPPERTDQSNLTAGAGLTLDRVSFDYAAETLSRSRIAHRFGIRLR